MRKLLAISAPCLAVSSPALADPPSGPMGGEPCHPDPDRVVVCDVGPTGQGDIDTNFVVIPGADTGPVGQTSAPAVCPTVLEGFDCVGVTGPNGGPTTFYVQIKTEDLAPLNVRIAYCFRAPSCPIAPGVYPQQAAVRTPSPIGPGGYYHDYCIHYVVSYRCP